MYRWNFVIAAGYESVFTTAFATLVRFESYTIRVLEAMIPNKDKYLRSDARLSPDSMLFDR